jgi:hypothetical protein
VAPPRRSEADALPVLLRFFAIPLAALSCFLFFLHLGFPYDRLAGRIAEQLGRATRSEIRIGELVPGLSLRGPGLAAIGVTATPHAGSPIQLERAFLRPAWSPAWLRGTPALHLDLTGVDLAAFPLASALPGASLQGSARIGLDLVLGQEAPEGSSRFDIRDGALQLPGLPMPVSFTRLEGELRYGGANLVEIESATLSGPLLSLVASGTLGRGASVETSPLQLDLEITAQPALRAPLEAAGVALASDGKGKLRLTGTPASPEIR